MAAARRRIRKDAMDQLKGKYEADRKKRLAVLFEDDLESDNSALRRGWLLSTNPPYPYSNPRTFLSYSMDGKPGYILEDLLQYAKSMIGGQEFTLVSDLMKDKEWLKGTTEGYGDDLPYTDTGSGAGFLKQLYSDHKEFVEKNSDPRLWRELVLADRFLKKVRVFRRLLDSRNAGYNMDSEPQPDGKNIQDRHLRTAWVLNRAWIRSLHYRSLSLGNDDFGFQQIESILQIATSLLAFEVQDHGFFPVQQQQNSVRLNVFLQLNTKIVQALEIIGNHIRAQHRAPRSNGVPYEFEETVASNIAPHRFRLLLQKHFGPIRSEWLFYADLWELSAAFERAHDFEHVEDSLVNKRIVYGDEWAQLTEALKDPNWVPSNIAYLPAIRDDTIESKKFSTVLRKISEVNRLRQSYLTLRDWMERWPWKQLYHIYDTKAGAKTELIPQINSFYQTLDALKAQYPMPAGQHIPTNYANMFSSLFPIHPIASTYMPEFLDGNCTICQESFKDSAIELIVQLHCDHAHHFTCIRDYWDNPNTLFGAKCVVCRSTNKEWILHTIASIKVECLDVWDYERIHPTRPGSPPDDQFSDTYKWLEDYSLNNSYFYNEFEHGGYRNLPGYDTPEIRHPDVEMGVVRWARRQTNAQRRNLQAHLRQSVHSLDPGFRPPALQGQFLDMGAHGPGEDPDFQPSLPIQHGDAVGGEEPEEYDPMDEA